MNNIKEYIHEKLKLNKNINIYSIDDSIEKIKSAVSINPAYEDNKKEIDDYLNEFANNLNKKYDYCVVTGEADKKFFNSDDYDFTIDNSQWLDLLQNFKESSVKRYHDKNIKHTITFSKENDKSNRLLIDLDIGKSYLLFTYKSYIELNF